VALASALLPMAATTAYSTDLFFSEYVEPDGGNNKALEIYNATGATVDLGAGAYSIEMYFNGNPSAAFTISLTGTVASGDVFVVAPSNASDATILAQADLLTAGTAWFNGNDAVVLRKGSAVIDSIGQVGVNPGVEWGSAPTRTYNNTLRRLPSVCAGDASPYDDFDPALQWTGHGANTFGGLGAHTSDCLVPPEPRHPIINEFSADTVGDDYEYVEVFGDPGTDYAAYTILEIEGDDFKGTVDEVIAAGTTDDDGLFLANLTTDSLDNGTITLLLVEGFTGSLGDDLDTNDDGVLDATPWTAVSDGVAVDDGGAGDLTYALPVLGPNFDGLDPSEPGGASRIPNGADTDSVGDWMRNDFDLAGIPPNVGTPVWDEALNTPGALNQAVPESCGDPSTSIPAVQGSGPVSPLLGAEVAVEGVVVGDFQTGGLDGPTSRTRPATATRPRPTASSSTPRGAPRCLWGTWCGCAAS
jgi:hypothetical protein